MKRIKITKTETQAKLDRIYKIINKHHMTDKEFDEIWEGMATFCMYQLQEGVGPFHEIFNKIIKTEKR